MLLMLTDVTAAQLPQPIVASTYRNPINLGNMGDPYVLRWNGRYYLYPTTGGQGLRSWVSEDLIHWQSLGYVAQEPVPRRLCAGGDLLERHVLYVPVPSQ